MLKIKGSLSYPDDYQGFDGFFCEVDIAGNLKSIIPEIEGRPYELSVEYEDLDWSIISLDSEFRPMDDYILDN